MLSSKKDDDSHRDELFVDSNEKVVNALTNLMLLYGSSSGGDDGLEEKWTGSMEKRSAKFII